MDEIDRVHDNESALQCPDEDCDRAFMAGDYISTFALLDRHLMMKHPQYRQDV